MDNTNNNSINNSQIQPTNPVVIPNAPPTTDLNALVGSFQNTIPTLETGVTNAEGAVTNTQNDILTLSKQLEGQTADQINAENAQGLPVLNKDLLELQKKARQQETEYLSAFVNQEGKQNTRAETTVAQQNLQRQNAIDVMLTNSLIQSKQGDVKYAQDIADRAIKLKYDPIRQSIETKLKFYDINKDNLSRADKKLFDEKSKQWDLQLKEVDKLEEFQKTALNNAMLNNAPQSVLQSISRAGSIEDITKLGSTYLQSPADKLDLQIKRAQLTKLNQELSTKNTDVGDLVKIGGKDYIRYKDGTISEPVLPDAADTGVVVSRLDEKLKTLGKLTNPSVGLATSAGSLRGAPIPFLAKGKINDWRADAVNIIQKLTVDELGRVKSDGVTFGALSNGERQAVGDAATALSAASIRDKDGNPTGRFKMSEKKVIEEFNKIKQGYELDFQKRTGIPYADYINNPNAIKNKVADDFIDQSATALQNNSYYGNYTTN